MAEIKKGTYRWHDELTTIPITTELSIPIKFSCTPRVVFDLTKDEAYTALGSTLFSSMYWNYVDAGTNTLTYHATTGECSGVYAPEHGWEFGYKYLTEFGLSCSEDLKGYGQTVTISEDFMPSSADEEAFVNWFLDNTEPVENEITDLTGTTWTISAGWISPNRDSSHYYYINGSVTYNGSTYNGLIYFRKSESNHLYFMLDGQSFYIQNKYDITFAITGGADATNPELIAWFESDGRLIKTLKGVWLLKENPDVSSSVTQYFDFTNRMYQNYGTSDVSGGPASYSDMYVRHYNQPNIVYTVRRWDGLEWMHDQLYVYNAETGWSSDAYRRVAFLYEQEVNWAFYDWFTANATEITNEVALVEYDGRSIGMLETGEALSLKLPDLSMKTDVRVIAPKTELAVVPAVVDSTNPTLKGVWRFKKTINVKNENSKFSAANINAKVVGYDHRTYTHVKYLECWHLNGVWYMYYHMPDQWNDLYDIVEAYTESDGWLDERYRYIYFPFEQTVDASDYQWFIDNAEDITDCTTRVEFDDKMIAVLLGGMTVRLVCGDLVVPSNVRVVARKVSEIASTAGLFDADDNLVASWDTLVNTYGMDCEKDYNRSTYATDTASPYYVLRNNDALSSGVKLVLSDSITSIGSSAFRDCDNLMSITIGNGVTSIGAGAFNSCNNLTSITIPDGVTSIGDYAFDSCHNLTSITVDDNNTTYQSIDGNLYTKDGATLLQYALGKTDASIVIPDSVTNIGNYAFYYCHYLTSITIPDGVTSIGDYAFWGSSSLTSVTIPASITSIGNCAFAACRELESITVDSTNTAYQSIDGNLYTKDGATLVQYAIGKTDTSITIPEGVTTIIGHAFQGCSSLTSVTMPTSITSIGQYAFDNCINLTNVYYTGTEEQWAQISILGNNDSLTNATVHYNHVPATTD